MKRYFYYLTAAAMLFAAFSCKDDPEVEVKASFTTDKEAYEVGDPVVITNTSTVSGAQIAVYKWEYQGTVSYDETPTGIIYTEAGQYTIKLTVTADMGAKKSSFEKTITVEDNNVRPVADFSYSPTEVTAGEEVQFTDLSTDSDGTITKWEWKFGTGSSTEQNPKYTFSEAGKIEVSLTVTDNKLGKNTKSVTIDVAKGAVSFELLWSKAYDSTDGAYVFGTSPAVSHDGKFVYVTSTGYKLTCFSKEGEKKWDFNLNPDNKSSAKGGHSDTPANTHTPHPTPSVDEDGTVFAAVGYNYEASSSAYSSFLYAVKGGADGGSKKWASTEDPKGHMTFFTPTITDDYVMMTYRNGTVPNTSSHLHVYDKNDGSFVFGGHCNSGSRGGLMAMKDGKIVAGVGGHWGFRLFLPDGDGKWKFNKPEANDNEYNLGRYNNLNGNPHSSQPASGPGGKAYLLFNNVQDSYCTNAVGGTSVVVHYASISGMKFGVAPGDPTWVCAVKGVVGTWSSGSACTNWSEAGNGIAVGEDGTVYVATGKQMKTPTADNDYAITYTTAYDSYLTAITAAGSIKWEHKAEGNIQGVPAVDDNGYVYYNDADTGKLVKLDPATGNVVTSISLGDELRSSPTISYDGTIYVTGMKDGKPTVFAVKGDATGCSDSWSQLGGNPSKTACMY